MLCSPAYAGEISAPPPLPEEPREEQDYFHEIYRKINVLEVTTSAPDGTRKGRMNEPILYNNSGTFTLWVNVDGDTDWQQI